MTTKFLELEDNLLAKIAKTYEKTEESLNEEVKEIRKWLETQHHLPEVMEERLVRNFYLLNKCRVERTKQKIDNYYTIRCQSPIIFNNVNPSSANMTRLQDVMYIVPLPKLTEDMCRVYIFKPRDKSKLNDVDLYDLLRHYINMIELRLHEDYAYQDICVVDAKDFNLKFMLKVTPFFIYNTFVTVYEKIYSSRLKGLYLINAPAFLETVVTLLKKIVKPKLANRFHLSKDAEILKTIFSTEILPRDYGGSERSCEEIQSTMNNGEDYRIIVCISVAGILKQKFVEYQERFDQLDNMKVDESLRPEKEKQKRFFGLYQR